MNNKPLEIAKQVLWQEGGSIIKLQENIGEEFNKAIDLILNRRGRLLVFGLGKSGHIGKKIAATLASTGQPSFFIHATEAAHGDLGMMMEDDICILISHSGNTREVLATIPTIKRLGLPIIAITSNSKSKLAHLSDIVLNPGVKKEACPLNLAPTTSTTVTLALGDAIAITLLTLKGFDESQYALFHPSGSLGKRLLLRVSDIMISEDLPICKVTDSFREALKVMTKGKQGVTIIVDDKNKCIGILTDGDIRRTFMKYDRISDIILHKIITSHPCTIKNDTLAMEALRIMQEKKITSLIVDNKKDDVVGLIHIHHLLEQGLY
jgi:arabinose-5-phosphate isomerase